MLVFLCYETSIRKFFTANLFVQHTSQHFQTLFNAHQTALSSEQLVCCIFANNSHIRCQCSKWPLQFKRYSKFSTMHKNYFY